MNSAGNAAVTRRLAAIVIADVVGYTRLMERDDTGTFARLRSIRDEVVDPAIVSHDGRIVKTAGDGLLAEFPSALAALRASVQIQRETAKRNEGVAKEERIDYRIGVNLGDIMVDGSDIVGDGVNVASRLEALAEPGGICVSGSVREQVHGQMAVSFEDSGEQQVKNIERPIRIHRVVVDAATPAKRGRVIVPSSPRARAVWGIGLGLVAAVAAATAWWHYRSPVDPGAPAMSVGVVPVAATSASPEASQRSESITRDLAAQLALTDASIRVVPLPPDKSGDIAERSRLHRVRYVLEGDLEPRAGISQIRLRMVEGSSGALIWNETVSLTEPAIPKEQARSLRTATEHLDRRLRDVEVRRVAALGERATAPTELVMKAGALSRGQKTLESLRKEQALCERALELEPDLLPAMGCITSALDGQLDLDSTSDRKRLIQRMDDVTSAAVKQYPGAPEAWEWRDGALMYMGRWDAALEASARAIQLDPYAAYHVSGRAWLMTMTGRPAEAVSLVAEAIAMDPPGNWWTVRAGCEAHLLLGQYNEAIAACERAAGRGGDEFDLAYFLAPAYAHVGNTARAESEAAKILRSAPGFTIAALRAKQYSTNPEYMRLAEEHWYSGLRKAGIPEK